MGLLPDPCRYIVLEGADGAGKSTLAGALSERLRALGCGVSLLRFPTSISAPGQLIRRVFAGLEQVSEKAMAYLLIADLVEMNDQIADAYARGDFVIADRHPLVSGWVYQTEVYSIEALLGIQHRAQFMYPDRVFIVDVPTEISEERISARAEERNTLYEKHDPAYQNRLRQRYIAYSIMHKEHSVLLDGEGVTADLVEQMMESLNHPGVLRADGSLRTSAQFVDAKVGAR